MDASKPSSGLLIAPSLEPTLERDHLDRIPATLERRDAVIAVLAVLIALAATAAAEVLIRTIALVTNLAYFGRWSFGPADPADHHLGLFAIAVPVLGGIVVGLMARYGSRAIRGHGIPEAMEQILTNESRIPLRMTFLKPTSAAIAIGSGGPFGAEGPIIATGGALGSALGQLIHVTATERKTLLAAGAAAGMTAIFGTPIAAMLLAIELLLFEYKARSIVPVALAAAAAGLLRMVFHGDVAAFAMPDVPAATAATTIVATLAGGIVGVLSTYVTRIVYGIEDRFEKLPIHWMWWPAIGGLVVGLVGIVQPHTLGVGYTNIDHALSGEVTAGALAALCAAKFVSWAIALGSGTSGGTLAPLLTLGSGLGWLLTSAVIAIAPHAGIDPRVGALVGMTAMFAGASRALLASIAFALESTQHLHSAVPVVAGVSVAYFVSCLMMKTTIMTERLARRGVPATSEYDVDPLAHVHVSEIASRELRVMRHDVTAAEAIADLDQRGLRHQGYPVVEGDRLVGVVTRTMLLAATPTTRVDAMIDRVPVTARPRETARAAAIRMAHADVGRIVVVDDASRPVGIVTRSDLIAALARARR